jgi:hypothetical protein
MEVKVEYQTIFKIVNQIISCTNDILLNSDCSNRDVLEDIVLTEMNDLLLGIENGQIYLTDTRCLASTYYVTDGAVKEKPLIDLIHELQENLDKSKYVKKHSTGRLLEHILSAGVGILGPSAFVFLIYAIFQNPVAWGLFAISISLFVATFVALCFNSKKRIKYNYQLFPNLPYQNCKSVIMTGYKDEDILLIQYDHVAINLGYIENEDKYLITVLKRNVTPSKSIIEIIEVKKRYWVERVLFEAMKKYENLSFSN